MAGYVAENIRTGLVRIAPYDAPMTDPEATLLDVREEAEVMAYAVPNAINIPLGKLRERMNELDPKKRIIVFCGIGVRAYTAARILDQNGFKNTEVYPGGVRLYQANYPEPEEGPIADVKKEVSVEQATITNKIRLDCCGMQCPGPIMEVFRSVKEMKDGELLEVSASDPGFAKDIASWCKRTGNTLVSNEERDGAYVAIIRRGTNAPAVQKAAQADAAPKGKTIIVFDGDMDKVLASFVIANGALAMGRPVTMFFTFWGLTALRTTERYR